MRKIICLAIILLSLLICAAAAADAININTSGEFQDSKFRDYLLSLPEGADGILTDEEIARIKYIEVEKCGITNLKGIKLFKNLLKLNCAFNSLSELDVSGMTSLNELYCSYNNLTSLNVNGCSSLSDLTAMNNNLSSLSLSGCSSLKELAVHYNNLSSLNINVCPKLKILGVSSNQLTSLNLSACSSSLLYLDVADNLITSLNVNGCSSLISLFCENNRMSSLDISTVPKIRNVFRKGSMTVDGNSYSYFLDIELPPDYASSNMLVVDQTTVVLANTVSFDANGGVGAMKSMVLPNDTASVLTANSFTRNGWTFASWNTSKDGSGTTYKNYASVTLKNEDLELYAQWKMKKISGLKLKAVSKESIKASWNKLSAKDRKGIKNIQIQVSKNKNFKTLVLNKIISSKKTSYTIKGLKANTKYYVRVRAYTKKGSSKYVSDWSVKYKKTKKK